MNTDTKSGPKAEQAPAKAIEFAPGVKNVLTIKVIEDAEGNDVPHAYDFITKEEYDCKANGLRDIMMFLAYEQKQVLYKKDQHWRRALVEKLYAPVAKEKKVKAVKPEAKVKGSILTGNAKLDLPSNEADETVAVKVGTETHKVPVSNR